METVKYTEETVYRWICPKCQFPNDDYEKPITAPNAVYHCIDCDAEVNILSNKKTPGEKKAELIERIIQLRKMKNNFREIAEILNSDKTPTFSGNGKWHAQTVHKLFKS